MRVEIDIRPLTLAVNSGTIVGPRRSPQVALPVGCFLEEGNFIALTGHRCDGDQIRRQD